MSEQDNDTPARGNDPRQTAILSRMQAAAHLGVSVRTFNRIQKEAAIPYVMVGRRRKYLKRDLDDYLQSNRSV